MDNDKLLIEKIEVEILIKDMIIKSNYPKNHPFVINEQNLTNDFLFQILCMLYTFVHKSIVEDFIVKKLISIDKGGFSLEKFHQNMNEVTFLWYIVSSLISSKKPEYINNIKYESDGKNSKKFEYSLVKVFHNKTINFEIKTVTCDPFLRETKSFKIGDKYIKPYFKKIDLSKIENLKDYETLEYSTTYSQIKGAMQKISKKFEEQDNNINIAVIVGQFATSWEEFLSYFMHQKKGLLKDCTRYFKNCDALIFFSLSSIPDITMSDIYEDHHIYTMLTSKKIDQDILKNLRMDNIFYNNGIISEFVKPYVNLDYGKFILEEQNGLITFINENISNEKKEEYFEKIKLYK